MHAELHANQLAKLHANLLAKLHANLMAKLHANLLAKLHAILPVHTRAGYSSMHFAVASCTHMHTHAHTNTPCRAGAVCRASVVELN